MKDWESKYKSLIIERQYIRYFDGGCILFKASHSFPFPRFLRWRATLIDIQARWPSFSSFKLLQFYLSSVLNLSTHYPAFLFYRYTFKCQVFYSLFLFFPHTTSNFLRLFRLFFYPSTNSRLRRNSIYSVRIFTIVYLVWIY